MARAHRSHSFPPNILRHHRDRVHSKIANRNPEHIPELGSIQISQPHFPELRHDWQFLRKPPSHAPSSFPFHFPTTGPSRSPIRGPSGNFQLGTQPHRPARIQLKNFPENLHGPSRAQLPLQQMSVMCAQPHTPAPIQPPISITHHHSFHSSHPYSISHTWAIPGPLWSHCTRIQGWIPLPAGSSLVCSRISSRSRG